MHPSAAEFEEIAVNEYGFEPDIRETPESTKTAEEAANAMGCDLGQIVKSMVFIVNEEVVVVLTSGPNRVSESKLADIAGVPMDTIRTANPNEIKDTLGWSIGGVPPFGHENSVRVYLDESLVKYDTVWAGAGTPNAMFPIAPDRLRELANAEPVEIAE